MHDLCERLTHLLADLVARPDEPELRRLAAEERFVIACHVRDCPACGEHPGLDAFEDLPEEKLDAALDALLSLLDFGGSGDPEPVDGKTVRALRRHVDDQDEAVRGRVCALMEAYPALKLEALQLPADTDPLELFVVGECLRMAYVRYPSRGQPLEALMGRWGQLCAVDGTPLIPFPSIEGEIARTIEADNAKRLHIGNMAQWVFIALQYEPLLFRGLQAEAVMHCRKKYLKLTPRPRDGVQDGWET